MATKDRSLYKIFDDTLSGRRSLPEKPAFLPSMLNLRQWVNVCGELQMIEDEADDLVTV